MTMLYKNIKHQDTEIFWKQRVASSQTSLIHHWQSSSPLSSLSLKSFSLALCLRLIILIIFIIFAIIIFIIIIITVSSGASRSASCCTASSRAPPVAPTGPTSPTSSSGAWSSSSPPSSCPPSSRSSRRVVTSPPRYLSLLSYTSAARKDQLWISPFTVLKLQLLVNKAQV